jgi:hypothetical protein
MREHRLVSLLLCFPVSFNAPTIDPMDKSPVAALA